MMNTKIIREFFGLDDEEFIEEESEDISVEDLFRAEIEEVLAEMASEHADTEKYDAYVKHLKVLTEAWNEYKRGEAETLKVEADINDSRKQSVMKLSDTAVRIVCLVLSAKLTQFYFGVEQNRPTPVRYIQKCQDFLTKRF